MADLSELLDAGHVSDAWSTTAQCEAIICLHSALSGIAERSTLVGPQTLAALKTWTTPAEISELCGRVLTAQRQRYHDTHTDSDPKHPRPV